MMTDPRPARMQWLTPYLMVKDAARSTLFYTSAFGFKVRNEMKKLGLLIHVEMEHQGELVMMFSPEGTFGAQEKSPASLGVMASQVFYLYVEEVDKIYAQALAAGAKDVVEPSNMFWGDRFAMIEDPDGYRWALAYHFRKDA